MAYAAYTYDVGTPTPTSGTPQHNSVTGSRGNVTTIQTQTNSTPSYLYRTYTYYDTGMLNTSTDVSTSSSSPGPTTTYNYTAGSASCWNSFPTSISEPLGLSRSMAYDSTCNGAVVISVTDENSQNVVHQLHHRRRFLASK